MSSTCEWCEGAGCEECTGGAKEADDWGDVVENEVVGASSPVLTRSDSFQFLSDEEIADRQKGLIAQCMQNLEVTFEEADCILRAYLWNIEKAQEEWFSGPDKIRAKIGVLPPLPKEKYPPKQVQCQTSLCDVVPISNARSLGCGHWFCLDCWHNFVSAQVMGGSESVYSVCPGITCSKKGCKHQSTDGCKCQQLLPEPFVRSFLKDKSLVDKYGKWMRDAFMEKNKTIRWCPRNGCSVAVEYRKGGKRDITCKCGHQFCFKCGLDSHSPVPCDLAQRFINLDSTDALTEALIKAITKPCPKCNVLIQKNEACIHMTCMKCRHEFCWLCKRDWHGHGGSYYSCQKFNDEKASGKFSDEQQAIIDNQKHLQKYTVYREQYNAHKKSVENNVRLIQAVENGGVEASRSKFLVDSLRNLADGHRLLQWSYCLTYFLKEGKEKKLFLFQQNDLQNICKEFNTFVTGKAIEALCELQAREQILNWSRTVEKARKSTLDALEAGDIIEVIMNEADASNDTWACTKCNELVNDPKAELCPKCQACRLHGEKSCWGCKPR